MILKKLKAFLWKATSEAYAKFAFVHKFQPNITIHSRNLGTTAIVRTFRYRSHSSQIANA
jgi:hypothetical protein